MKAKFSWIRRILLLALAAALLIGLSACQIAAETDAEPAETVMAVVTAAPVVTYGEPAVLPFPETQAVPEGYTRISEGDEDIGLFAFTDTEGDVQYRVFGGYAEYIDGVESETFTGFYASDETGAILSADAGFADVSAEPFGVCVAMELPETLRYRGAYQSTDCVGECTDDSGNTFVYGSFDDGDGAFYPSDGQGNMIPGALKSEARITVPSYTPTSVPSVDGERMLVVYIGTETVVAYIAEDGEWTQERVMICSTGRSKDLTPRGTFAIMRQYLYKKMGQVDGENVYSQYASRITGNYLFHSVPIGGERRYLQSYGKEQMYVKYYERLGTAASGGCVRLRCIDAYWIYMNCEVGTTVVITDDCGPEAPEIPALIYEEPYMDSKHEYGWDPSDPDPENPYHAIYTPEVVLDGPVVDKSDADAQTDSGD